MNRWLDRLIRRVVQKGRLEVTWSDGIVSVYGAGGGGVTRIVFHDPKAEAALLRNPEMAIGEAYMDGGIEFPGDGLLDFLLLLNENWEAFIRVPFIAAISRLRFAKRRFTQNNSMLKSRRNVAHHYDLDEKLYRLFLDGDLQYSCAYFESPNASLEQAQFAKKRHIASKLALKPGMEVLDIGSGWGGLGLFLAENFGVNVTGVTLSTEQHRLSNQRALEQGLDQQARFELRDYRSLDRKFDRIVSVGMFEHVGVSHFGEYFNTVRDLLKPEGVALIHSIGRFGPPGATNPWIAKYIFPGGYIPAVSEVMKAIEKAELLTTDMEILRLHYAETLRAWRARFRSRWEEAARLYDERFCRMWDMYLAGSEASFRAGAGGMMVFQVQLAKSLATLPITRNYMFNAEAEMNRTIEGPESLRLAGE